MCLHVKYVVLCFTFLCFIQLQNEEYAWQLQQDEDYARQLQQDEEYALRLQEELYSEMVDSDEKFQSLYPHMEQVSPASHTNFSDAKNYVWLL